MWVYPGEGDSYSENRSSKSGVITKDTWHIGGKAGVEFTIGWGKGLCGLKIYAEANGGYQKEMTDYSEYKEENSTFTTQNLHTGPICRRYVKDLDTQIVTLMVYRMTPDGGVEGKSITVNII